MTTRVQMQETKDVGLLVYLDNEAYYELELEEQRKKLIDELNSYGFEFSYDDLEPIDKERPKLSYHVKTKVEVQIKYEGYIKKQLQDAERFDKLEKKLLPSDIDYMSIIPDVFRYFQVFSI